MEEKTGGDLEIQSDIDKSTATGPAPDSPRQVGPISTPTTPRDRMGTELQPLLPNQQFVSYSQASLQLFKEAWPFFTTRLIELGSDYFSMLLLANIDADTLAASSLITTSQVVIRSVNAVFLYYTAIMAVQAKASNKMHDVSDILKASWIFAVVISVPSTVLAVFSEPIFNVLAQPAITSQITQQYLRAYASGVTLTLLSISNQQLTVGLGKPLFVLGTTILSRSVLLPVGYGLMYGKLGLPNLGVAGLGYAYTLSYIVYFLASLAAFNATSHFGEWKFMQGSFKNIYSTLNTLVLKGVPIGIYAFVELGSLSFATILIGRSGTAFLAAVQPAIQYGLILANSTYAIGTTLGVIVGRELKNRQLINATRYSNIGISVCTALPAITLAAFVATGNLFVRPFIDSADKNNINVIANAHLLLGINLIGQLFDGIRNSLTGVLRGFGDTNSAMIINLATGLGINVPLALAFAFISVLKNLSGPVNNADGIFFARAITIALGALALYVVYDKTIRSTREKLAPAGGAAIINQSAEPTTESESALSQFSKWCCTFTSSSRRQQSSAVSHLEVAPANDRYCKVM